MEKRCTAQERNADADADADGIAGWHRPAVQNQTRFRNAIRKAESIARTGRSDKRFINIQMFIRVCTGWTEARLADARLSRRLASCPRWPRDRYDDNEDKRGAKFLVGTADRVRYCSARVNRMCDGVVQSQPWNYHLLWPKLARPEIPSESGIRWLEHVGRHLSEKFHQS